MSIQKRRQTYLPHMERSAAGSLCHGRSIAKLLQKLLDGVDRPDMWVQLADWRSENVMAVLGYLQIAAVRRLCVF